MEVICAGDPLEAVAEFFERVCETLDVACAVVEKVEAHGGRTGAGLAVSGRRDASSISQETRCESGAQSRGPGKSVDLI